MKGNIMTSYNQIGRKITYYNVKVSIDKISASKTLIRVSNPNDFILTLRCLDSNFGLIKVWDGIKNYRGVCF
jgi:hypothetical protein